MIHICLLVTTQPENGQDNVEGWLAAPLIRLGQDLA